MGNVVEVGAVVRVAEHLFSGVRLGPYRGTVLAIQKDRKGPYLRLRTRGKGERLERSTDVEVIRGAPPPPPEPQGE